MKRDPQYRLGFADGLRQAAAIIGELEQEVVARLARGAATRLTQQQRAVRLQAYKTGRTRLTTALRATERRRQPIEDRLKEVGL